MIPASHRVDEMLIVVRSSIQDLTQFTWAVRLPVASLRPTNRETVEPGAFAWPQLSRPHNTRIAEASSPSAPLPNAVIEDRHRHKYPARAPVLVPRRPLGRSGDSPKTPGPSWRAVR